MGLPDDLVLELRPDIESLAEFPRPEESERQCGLRVFAIDQAAHELAIDLGPAVHCAEQWRRSAPGVVQVIERPRKGEGVSTRQIDIPHEGVSQILRLDAEADLPASGVTLIQSSA